MTDRPRGTSTSAFGVSRRENHDSSGFYSRFVPPDITNDSSVYPEKAMDKVFVGDARSMTEVPDASVALVVTSPPYFAGKEYEEALGQGHIPATYGEYLDMLHDVFAECVRTLEPGGRIAVNIANLGRRPYRSLSADVIAILQDRLRLLLRGEIVWVKARGSAGSFAWGSFQRPGNPVLRDVSERVVIASKGRFDRALPARKREELGLPSEGSMLRSDFMEATNDIWEIAAESATRVGHPAPFPVELPQRLIELYTYRNDLVLDPFMGSGTTAIAAVRSERSYVGYDTDKSYVEIAEDRIAKVRSAMHRERDGDSEEPSRRVVIPAVPKDADGDEDPQRRAVREGRAAKEIARVVLEEVCEFEIVHTNKPLGSGVEVNFVAKDRTEGTWYFDVSGAFTTVRPGLMRTDTLWKALGKAAVLHQTRPDVPVVLLTTDRPVPGSAGARALDAVTGPDRPIYAVIELLALEDQERLRQWALNGLPTDAS